MSRVAKNPVKLPKGVDANLQAQQLTLKSTKGQLQFAVHAGVEITIEGSEIKFTPRTPDADAQAGTARAIINNMVHGLSQGFERKLTLVGVGYRAQVQGKILNLTLGYSHPVNYDIPVGITIETPSQTEVIIKGSDRQLVGQVAAKIRGFRPPEPYKGKGVRYADEVIILKETKKK
jgi:large subunit ribosomal protein L6